MFKEGRTDHGQTTDGQGQLLRTSSGKPRVQKWTKQDKVYNGPRDILFNEN